ncbi:MAG: OsmC family protein [Liquorilactobacillus ghanensis]|uniref:OsmC family protein n=1 Tax=Liquorilactobacillus ghanensis TaxID=399370 RepID=UPI0039ED1F98
MGKYVVNSSIRNIGYQVGTQAGVHRYLMDEPTTARGTDAGPNPVQYLIGAVNGCLTITAQSVATKYRIKLEKFNVRSVGNVAKHADGTSEVDEISVNITFKADITGKAKDDFLAETLAKCTVHKTLAAGVKFTFNFEQE